MIAIIDYQAGNTRSVQYALQRLGAESIVTSDISEIRQATRVIFPGVGHAAPAMEVLRERQLHNLIPQLTQPVLGICLGMQLMCRFSEEGNTEGLGIFQESVFRFGYPKLKVPHMGWNALDIIPDALFRQMPEPCHVYFVHSYFVDYGTKTIATTRYGSVFSAAMRKNNFWAVQFHPEKSGLIGEQILQNFLNTDL